jgi:type II secretory ATPase GspE/PulE/Tfp pilus assembly ATPase PilB-like protein
MNNSLSLKKENEHKEVNLNLNTQITHQHLKEMASKQKILQMMDDIVSQDSIELSSFDKSFIISAIETKKLNHDQIEIIFEELIANNDKNNSVKDIVIEMGFLSTIEIEEVGLNINPNSSIFAKSGSVDILRENVDNEVAKRMPYEIIRDKSILPFKINNETLYVACDFIDESEVLSILNLFYTDCSKIIFVKSDHSSLIERIDLIFNDKDELDSIIEKITRISISNYEDDLKKNSKQVNSNIPTELIIELIDAIFVDAVKKDASDIHMEPEESFVRLRYRVNGDLKITKNLHKKYWNNILIRMKVIAGMNIAETRRPQDGKITIKVFERNIDCRVSNHPTIHGENIVIRLLDKKAGLLTLEQLGFSKIHLKQISKSVIKPEGVMVVVGPTGSGKTTTLYSILSILNKPDVNIMTLEDPVEYNIPTIRQTNINESVGLTFEAGMRALVRQDPDIILIGEIRDAETLRAAIRMSMTGHKVFTTLHAIDSISAIQRLVDIGADVSSLVGNIVAISSQRLVKNLCSNCKVKVRPTKSMAKSLQLTKDDVLNANICVPKGCNECGGFGYKGRSVIAEVLEFNDEVDDLVYNRATRSQMKTYLMETDFVSMFDDAKQKILNGITDINEVSKAIKLH